jgi:hypothetical protein
LIGLAVSVLAGRRVSELVWASVWASAHRKAALQEPLRQFAQPPLVALQQPPLAVWLAFQ